MKIKTKLILEIIVLFTLIAMISIISINNANHVQDTVSSLNNEMLPTLDELKNMRIAATEIPVITRGIILIEDETRNTANNEYIELEEVLETNFYKIEQAKSKFNESFSQYVNLINEKHPENMYHTKDLAEKWNEMVVASNKLIQLKTSGASGMVILNLNKNLDLAYNNMNKVIDDGIELTAVNIEQKQLETEFLINEITWSMIIALNIFILTALVIRFLIVRSISNPLNKIRQTTHAIAKGRFEKYDVKGKDEISELGNDINTMSEKIKELNKIKIEKERLSAIGELSARLSHDIRNPLDVIKNTMYLLEPSLKQHPETSKYVTIFKKSVERIEHQITDVLNFIKERPTVMKNCLVTDIIKNSIESIIVPDNIKITVKPSDIQFNVDSSQMEIVFTNLIRNSIESIESDVGTISINVTEKEDDVIIEFADSGILNETMDKIFEPLFTTKMTGTGLGLISCKTIVENHGGKINASSFPTTFMIILPKI